MARDGATDALIRFAERLNLPVATTFLGKGVFPDNHPNALGTIGFMVKDYANFGFDRADVVVAVGYDLVEYSPERWNPNADKRIIHVHRTVAEVDANYTLEVGRAGRHRRDARRDRRVEPTSTTSAGRSRPCATWCARSSNAARPTMRSRWRRRASCRHPRRRWATTTSCCATRAR